MKRKTRNQILTMTAGIISGILLSLIGGIITGTIARNEGMGLAGIGLVFLGIIGGYILGSAIATNITLILFKEKGSIIFSFIGAIIISIIMIFITNFMNKNQLLSIIHLIVTIFLIPYITMKSYYLKFKKTEAKK